MTDTHPPAAPTSLSATPAAALVASAARLDLTVVVVNYNALAYVRRCLASLVEGAAGLRWEAVVVDNASRERGVEALAEEWPNVRVLRRARNGGFAVGANAGIRAARADTVLLLNPDAALRPGAARRLVEYLRAHPEVGALGPRIENPDGTLQLSCRRFPTHWTGIFNRYALLTRLRPRNRLSASYLMTDWDHASTRAVDWLSGAVMMLPRHAWERAGLFDERYFFSCEDVDLCRRLRDAGLRAVYLPEAVAVHEIGVSSRTARTRVIIARHQGMWRYYRAHMRGGALLDAATAVGIGLRCLLHLTIANARRLCAAAAPHPQPPSQGEVADGMMRPGQGGAGEVQEGEARDRAGACPPDYGLATSVSSLPLKAPSPRPHAPAHAGGRGAAGDALLQPPAVLPIPAVLSVARAGRGRPLLPGAAHRCLPRGVCGDQCPPGVGLRRLIRRLVRMLGPQVAPALDALAAWWRPAGPR